MFRNTPMNHTGDAKMEGNKSANEKSQSGPSTMVCMNVDHSPFKRGNWVPTLVTGVP